MNSLINFDGFADVANNLIDKISEAIGWIVTHDTPNKMAEKIFIEDVKNSNLDPESKAKIISNSKKIIKERKNQEDIIKIALQNLSSTALPSAVDDDWIAQFMDKARLVSNEEFKILWGKILAEECNVPGTIPKALLHIMEQMDKNMATAFIKLVSISVNFEDEYGVTYFPIIDTNINDMYYRSKGFYYNDLADLSSIGLIEMNFLGKFKQSSSSKSIDIKYFDQIYTLKRDKINFSVGHVIYTRAGMALCKSIQTDKVEGFFEEKCIPLFE